MTKSHLQERLNHLQIYYSKDLFEKKARKAPVSIAADFNFHPAFYLEPMRDCPTAIYPTLKAATKVAARSLGHSF